MMRTPTMLTECNFCKCSSNNLTAWTWLCPNSLICQSCNDRYRTYLNSEEVECYKCGLRTPKSDLSAGFLAALCIDCMKELENEAISILDLCSFCGLEELCVGDNRKVCLNCLSHMRVLMDSKHEHLIRRAAVLSCRIRSVWPHGYEVSTMRMTSELF